jgi:hypothetical protein
VEEYGRRLRVIYRRGREQATMARLGVARGARGRARACSGVQSASNTWRCSSAHVQKLAEIAYVRILAKIRHLWLSLVCEFQGKISPRSEDMRTPNLACLPAHFMTKVMPRHVKRQGLGVNFFQGVP